jgi:hypothetical protein
MHERGWTTDEHGRWFDPVERARTNRHFRAQEAASAVTPSRESVLEESSRPGGRTEAVQLQIAEAAEG